MTRLRGNVPFRHDCPYRVLADALREQLDGVVVRPSLIEEAVAAARAEWEADHEKNGGNTYFHEMVHLQRKCVALGTDVETYKRLTLDNGAARDHAIKEWHASQARNAELSAKLKDAHEALKSAQQEDVVIVGSRLWRAEGELLKARAKLGEPHPGLFECDRCGRLTPNSQGGDDDAPGSCATCWLLHRTEVERDEALATAERRQGTIDKLTVERDEALKGRDAAEEQVFANNRTWQARCDEINLAAGATLERQRDASKVLATKLTAERDSLLDKVLTLEERTPQDHRDDLKAHEEGARTLRREVEREKARAERAEAELPEALRDRTEAQQERDAALRDALRDRMRAERAEHATSNARRETLEEVIAEVERRDNGIVWPESPSVNRERAAKLGSLHSWLRAQLAETKTQAIEVPVSALRDTSNATPNAGPVGHESPATIKRGKLHFVDGEIVHDSLLSRDVDDLLARPDVVAARGK